MTLSIGENLSTSFEFAKDGLVGQWVRWIILILVTCIPIVNFITSFIASGYLVKIYRGGSVAPELEDYVGMFVDGIKLAIIGIVYFIIPLIVIFAGLMMAGFGGLVGFAGADAGEMGVAGAGIAIATPGVLLMLIGAVLAIVFSLVATVAGIRFAKTGALGEGFNFGAVFATMKEIGWLHYFLSCLVFGLAIFFIFFVIIIISSMLGLIPVIGQLLPFVMQLLLFILVPVFLLWQGKFFENLYSRA